jgi:hypothetical protein
VIKQSIPYADFVTNELLDDINAFDTPAIVAEAKAWKPK